MSDPRTPEPAEPYLDYSRSATPMAELAQLAEKGDLIGFYEAAREQTLFDRSDPVVLVLALSMLIASIAGLVRRTGEAAKPVIEAAADNMRRRE